MNHAGEHGAVSIYETQLARANQSFQDLAPWLEETLSHEVNHRKHFKDAMPTRGAKPCRLMFVWSFGGALLGGLSTFLGRAGIYACTIAVEKTVHRHLVEQIAFLEAADKDLAGIVSSILIEEDAHLHHAQSHQDSNGMFINILEACVSAATELLIFVSTRGDSLRLKKELARFEA